MIVILELENLFLKKNFSEAYESEYEPYTGGYNKNFDSIVHSITSLIGKRNMEEFFIGICSQGTEGLEDRWNQKYKNYGYTGIIPLYQTSSDSFRKELETQLTEKFWNGEKRGNERKGGGGPIGTPPYFVYIAYKSQ